MTRIAAVILAGGKAERLGGLNKALLEIGGARLVDRAIAAAAGCDPMLLATGHSGFAVERLVSLADLNADYGGPLAGVAAAVGWLRADPPEFLLSLAVDTPFFPHDFVARAMGAIGDAAAVIAAYEGQDYPTNALWRLGALAGLPDGVVSGTAPRSLRRLAEGLGAARLDYAGIAADDPFANANTPEDLEILRLRAGGK